MDLILDIKVYIALLDEEVWIKLVLYDDEFKQYAYTPKGQIQFVNYFTIIYDNKTTLLGYIHSIDDKPSIIYRNGDKEWYYKNMLHRENDLPAVIDGDGSKMWYYHDKLHRENDLPSIIHGDGAKMWFIHDKLHRGNDLPADMGTYGNKWYYGGELHRENNLPAVMYFNGNHKWYCGGKEDLEKNKIYNTIRHRNMGNY